MMTSAYWTQWSHAELMSMHGVEVDTYEDEDQNDYHYDRNEEEKELEGQECCSGCMYCLGFSWRDFM
jgi:hypothetical protein